MGPHATAALQAAGKHVFSYPAGTVRQAIEAYKRSELMPITSPGPAYAGVGAGARMRMRMGQGTRGDQVGRAWQRRQIDMRRVVIPTDDAEGKSLAGHFGRAQYFVLVELDETNRVVRRETHTVNGEHTGGHGFTHDNIMRLKPNAVIVGGMGPRGIASFQNQGVTVLQANSTSVDDLVVAYISGRLGVLSEGCHEARHH